MQADGRGGGSQVKKGPWGHALGIPSEGCWESSGVCEGPGLLVAQPMPAPPPPPRSLSRSLSSAGLPGAAPAGTTRHHTPLHSLHQAQQPGPGADIPPRGGNTLGWSCFVEGPIVPRRWRGEKWDSYSKWSDVRKGFSPQLWQDSRVRWCGLRTAQWPGHRQVGATVHLALCPPSHVP